MTTSVAQINVDDVRGAFREWQAEQEPLEAQLRESLDALLAYQSQLDNWQQQLAHDREALNTAREELSRDRAAAAHGESARIAELSTELNAAREKVATLSSTLLERTEELRQLDNRRAELTTELELTRARENELRASLEESNSQQDQERANWTDELRQFREILAQGALANYAPAAASATSTAADELEHVDLHPASDQPPAVAQSPVPGAPTESPVFGSVLQQFGKLRQQRAMERPPLKKAR